MPASTKNQMIRRQFIKIAGTSPIWAHFSSTKAEQIPDLTQVTLRVATFRGADQTLLAATGLSDFPYSVNFSEFNSGNLIAQAIDADAIDLGTWSEIPMVFAAATRSNVAIVATLDGPTTDQAVLIPRLSNVDSIDKLRGKRVGYIKATTAQYFLIRMLEAHGMGFSDIIPVALSMSDGMTAMKSGNLDAWATYGYAIQILEAQGEARILQSARDILSGHYFFGANASRLQSPAFQAAIADYIHRISQAYSILYSDKQKWANALSPVIHVSGDIVLKYLENQNRPYHPRIWTKKDIDDAQQVASVFIRAGILQPKINIQKIFSESINKRIADL